MKVGRVTFIVAGLICCGLSPLRAAMFMVTNKDDAGPGSLRQAIINANATPNSAADQPDRIEFAIPGGNVQPIALTSPLPPITEAVVLDGFRQNGSAPNKQSAGIDAMLRIELSGANVGDSAAFGVVIAAPDCLVRGLVINRFGGGGIHIGGSDATRNRIAGCFIGTNAAGNAALANGVGVRISGGAKLNTIGGSAPADRNLISGNKVAVQLEGSGTDSNAIQGNYWELI